MDSFTKNQAVEWLEQLDWMLTQMSEVDNGDLSLVIDLLSEGKDELESIME
jgi:hypothetical protein